MGGSSASLSAGEIAALAATPGNFVVEGRWCVEALLESELQILALALVGDQHPTLAARIPEGTSLTRISKMEAEEMAGYAFHRGVFAVAQVPPAMSLREWESSLDKYWLASSPLVVVPYLGDASNVGALIRNAAALGASAVVFGQQGAGPWQRKAVRNSAGAVFRLPVLVSPSLAEDLHWLRGLRGIELVALESDAGAEALPFHRFQSERLALLLGAEDRGLAEPWRGLAHRRVRIPMWNGVESLNVATSLAVFLTHLAARRERQSS